MALAGFNDAVREATGAGKLPSLVERMRRLNDEE
jgi:hypothetical protein